MDHLEIACEKGRLEAEKKAKADEKTTLETEAEAYSKAEAATTTKLEAEEKTSMYRAHDMFSRNFFILAKMFSL